MCQLATSTASSTVIHASIISGETVSFMSAIAVCCCSICCFCSQ
jgi:hypothetical protein